MTTIYELMTALARAYGIGYNEEVQRSALFAAGLAAGAFVAWRQLTGRARGAELAPGIVLDSSKARALLDLGREAARASVEQALSAKLERAA